MCWCFIHYPQPTFHPQCQRPSFTPIQNNGQYYGSNIICTYYNIKMAMFMLLFLRVLDKPRLVKLRGDKLVEGPWVQG